VPGWSTLDEEFVHPAVSLQGHSSLERSFVAASDIPEGTVIIRAAGVASKEEATDTSLLLRDVIATREASPDLFARFAYLCPQTLHEDESHYQKFANDRPELEKLQAEFSPAAELSVDELHLLMLKLDHNALAPGLFPLASLFNHSCSANCAGFLNDDDLYEVRTIAPVSASDQLTLNYLEEKHWYRPTSHRQKVLASRWHFTCACKRCSATTPPETDLIAVACPARSMGCPGWCSSLHINQLQCNTCGNLCPSDSHSDLINKTEALLEAAKRLPEDELQQLHDTLTSALVQVEGHVGPHHWLRIAVHKQLSDACFQLALTLRDNDSSTELQQRFQSLCIGNVLSGYHVLQAISQVYPSHDYHISVWHENILTALGRLEEDGVVGQDGVVGGTHVGTSSSHRTDMVRIRGVCGWIGAGF